jgi:hypothetical protein
MKMFKLLTPLLLLGFISCKKPQGFDYRDMRNFKVADWGFEKSTVSMDLVYFNPNKYGVSLKRVDCDVYLDNRFLGKFTLDTTMNIPREAEFTLPARMQVDMKNIFKNTFNVFFSKEVLVGAKGTTRIGKGGIYINVPFNYEGRHKVDF